MGQKGICKLHFGHFSRKDLLMHKKVVLALSFDPGGVIVARLTAVTCTSTSCVRTTLLQCCLLQCCLRLHFFSPVFKRGKTTTFAGVSS